MSGAAPGYKSKTLATWIALLGGCVGLHRFYLHGFRDRWGWLFIWPTLVGWYGVQRMRHLGADDHLAWVLIPFLGVMLSIAMLSAIIYGLTPDEKWNARFNAGAASDAEPGRTNWATIGAVVLALLFGTTVLMASIVFSFQRYFEHQVEEGRKISQ